MLEDSGDIIGGSDLCNQNHPPLLNLPMVVVVEISRAVGATGVQHDNGGLIAR